MSAPFISFRRRAHEQNKDTIQGGFTQLKARSNNSGESSLTMRSTRWMECHAEILAGKLQERYGLAKDDAERQAKEFRTRNNWN